MLSLSITGILAIVIVVLGLVIVLLGMTGRVNKLSTQLKVHEEDNITPYLRTVVHYKKSDFTDESKLNALNKISKQFFKDSFHFSSEKTFDEISSLTQDQDIKDFCSSIGVLRYSRSVRKSDIESLYRGFENILLKRRPASVFVLKESMAPNNKPMTIDDLNSRKFRKDVADIKVELDKMRSDVPLSSSSPVIPLAIQPNPVPVIPQQSPVIRSDPSSVSKFSVDDRLALMESEIDKESIHEQQLPPQAVAKIIVEPSPKISAPKLSQSSIIPSMPAVKHESFESVRQPLVIKPQVRKEVVVERPSRIVPPPRSKINSSGRGKSLAFDELRIGDESAYSREIDNLNSRIQKLLDQETDKQLGQMREREY